MLVLLLAASCVLCLGGVDGGNLDFCSFQLPRSTKTPDIVYYRVGETGPSSGGAESRMHYAWSMIGFPTLFISRSNETKKCNASIQYNQTAFNDSQSFGSVNISGSDSPFSFAVVFTRIIEFRVSHSKAKLDIGDLFNASTKDTVSYWLNRTAIVNFTYSDGVFHLTPNPKATNHTLTEVELQVEVPKKSGTSRLSYFPKTIYTDTSSTFDLTVKLSKYNRPFGDKTHPHGRVALEMMLINGRGIKGGAGEISYDESVDDEYTPSVFKTVKYKYGNETLGTGGFMSWKPITYQNGKRLSTASQQANWQRPAGGRAAKITDLPRGLATALFGESVESVGNATRFYMVFGTSGDETYLNPTYMTWTAAVGYGKPPKEKISIAVIITISLGLGIPGLLLLAGGVFVFFKKKPWENAVQLANRIFHRHGYSRIN